MKLTATCSTAGVYWIFFNLRLKIEEPSKVVNQNLKSKKIFYTHALCVDSFSLITWDQLPWIFGI